jgi:hypothetical protein
MYTWVIEENIARDRQQKIEHNDAKGVWTGFIWLRI